MNYVVTDEQLRAIADAIREKGGTSAQLLFPDGFVTAVGAIETGGGGGGGSSVDYLGESLARTLREYENTELTQLYDNAFSDNLSPISKLRLPNVSILGTRVFKNCRNATFDELKLSPKLKQIPMYAFENCTNMKAWEIPDSVENIGNYSFSQATNFKATKLPASIKYIGTDAFYKSGAMFSKIPVGALSIGQRCFAYCSNMTKLFIPSTVTKIYGSSYAYSIIYSSSVADIYTDAESAPSGWGTYFNYTASNIRATVHYGVSEAEFDAIAS